MSGEKCSKSQRFCAECGERVTACLTHDRYYVCEECSCRMPINNAQLKSNYDLIFKKVFGEKPIKPDNN